MSQGCRPLEAWEIEKIKTYFDNKDETTDPKDLALRNKTLIMFTCFCGFRIAEVLSLTINDIVFYGKVGNSVYLKKHNSKRKVSGRSAPLNPYCQELLKTYIDHYQLHDGSLFQSTRDKSSITPRMASMIFRDAFDKCELTGKLGTHSGRKTFAKKIYDALDRNIVDLQAAMGHKSLSSTQKYVSFDNAKVAAALDDLKF